LINNNVPYNTWANIGINIALGSVIDYKASNKEYQFLPEYTYDAFNNALINNIPLIQKSNILYQLDDKRVVKKSFSLLSPYSILSLLALLIISITYFNFKRKKKSNTLDFLILFVTGLTGVFSLLLWFATDHTTTANNFNVLWAFAPNLVMAFLIFKEGKTNFKVTYFKILAFLMFSLGIIWLFKIEAFSFGMIPIFIALFIRYIYLAFFEKV
jgi:membrane-associated HD superfamily phosphohydrolase